MPRMSSSLVRNWPLKLSALGLSIFFWALVQTEPLSQETFSSVPVFVDIEDTTWTTVLAPTPATVELRLGGPAREIIRLIREGTSLRVPVSAVGSRDTVIALERGWVQLGQRSGVTVESVSPATLRVSFEQAVTKSIPLSLQIRGELPEHLALSSELDMNQEAVLVRGPESRLTGLESLPLEPLDLASIRGSDIFTLVVDTSALGGASVTPPAVMVGVAVESMLEREFEGVVVRADVRGQAFDLIVEPSSVGLVLAGATTLVTAMDPSRLRVAVPEESLAGMVPGEARRVRLQVDGLPPLVTARVSTDVVTVRRVVEEPDVEEPGIDEPEVDEPEVDEPEVDEPEVDEPEVDEPEDAQGAS
jgi:hypothetical protein